jgi:hypothetical protein
MIYHPYLVLDVIVYKTRQNVWEKPNNNSKSIKPIKTFVIAIPPATFPYVEFDWHPAK